MTVAQEFLTKLSDAAIAMEGFLGKYGSDVDHVAVVSSASDEPYFVLHDTPSAAEQEVTAGLLCACRELKGMVGSEAISHSVNVYSKGDGKVMALPTAAGTYWCVGRSHSACAADGDPIKVEPHRPYQVTVTE